MFRFSKTEEDFQELYRTYHFGVRRALEAMVNSRAVAEELTQEAFLKAWKALPSFGFRSSLKTWVYQVAMNVGRDWLRSKKEKALQGSFEEAVWEDQSPEVRAIQEALMEMDESSRSLLVLHYYEGMGLDEIARVLGVPQGTVKSRLFAAKAKLRPLLLSKGFDV